MNETITFDVPEMQCSHCVQAIEKELGRLPEIDSVEVDLESKLVTVRGRDLDPETARGAIAAAGYEASPS